MVDIPDNVDLAWVARHILALCDEVKALRGAVDRLTIIVRRMRDEDDTTPLMLVRIERRLERPKTLRRPRSIGKRFSFYQESDSPRGRRFF